MADILVRNVDPDVLERLKERARHNNRSLQAELSMILNDAAKMDMREFLQAAAKIRASLAGKKYKDSAILIREDRKR